METKIAFDIDGTLIKEDGSVNQTLLNFILNLVYIENDNVKVYVWSGGGIPYVRQKLRELKLDGKVYITTKGGVTPDICIDDQKVNLAKINLQIV